MGSIACYVCGPGSLERMLAVAFFCCIHFLVEEIFGNSKNMSWVPPKWLKSNAWRKRKGKKVCQQWSITLAKTTTGGTGKLPGPKFIFLRIGARCNRVSAIFTFQDQEMQSINTFNGQYKFGNDWNMLKSITDL